MAVFLQAWVSPSMDMDMDMDVCTWLVLHTHKCRVSAPVRYKTHSSSSHPIELPADESITLPKVAVCCRRVLPLLLLLYPAHTILSSFVSAADHPRDLECSIHQRHPSIPPPPPVACINRTALLCVSRQRGRNQETTPAVISTYLPIESLAHTHPPAG